VSYCWWLAWLLLNVFVVCALVWRMMITACC
jgi:hypothetical protein